MPQEKIELQNLFFVNGRVNQRKSQPLFKRLIILIYPFSLMGLSNQLALKILFRTQ